jgi:hypothetical protein
MQRWQLRSAGDCEFLPNGPGSDSVEVLGQVGNCEWKGLSCREGDCIDEPNYYADHGLWNE